MPTSTILQISSSNLSINQDRRDLFANHFRWDSIKKFMYLASAYSGSIYNFDIFALNQIKVFDAILFAITVGMSYMFMDFFMILYTRRTDSSKLLNPLLRGVLYGLFLQTALVLISQAGYTADSLNYLAGSFQEDIPWSHCYLSQNNKNETCKASAAIIYSCDLTGHVSVYVHKTSVYSHYKKTFESTERSIVTKRIFLIVIVWINNFLISSSRDDNVLKILKLIFIYQTVTTIVIGIFMAITAEENIATAFTEIFNTNLKQSDYSKTMMHVQYIYGVGLLSLDDFSSMSPFTMVDNSIIIFSMIYTSLALLRSWIVRVLFLKMARCVMLSKRSLTTHYSTFTIIPMSTEFVSPSLLYNRYIYLNVIMSSTAYLSSFTIIMAKILNTEFRSIKPVYIVGLINFMGFVLTVLRILLKLSGYKVLSGCLIGMGATWLYVGGLKVALIMWVYGVQRFSTDIQYWLGFKPTKFWTISWTLLPIILWAFLVAYLYKITHNDKLLPIIPYACVWILLTVTVIMIFHIKTIAKYLFLNNVAAIFSANLKYGPPDSEDRKKRRNFDEIIDLRVCRHNTHPLDDMVECNHLMERITSDGSFTTSLTNFYEDKDREKRASTALEVHY